MGPTLNTSLDPMAIDQPLLCYIDSERDYAKVARTLLLRTIN